MPKELDLENLRICLDNYKLNKLYIRDCGGYREDGSYRISGEQKVNIKFNDDKVLDFKKNESGLLLIIDSEEIFHFPLNKTHNGFSLAYDRRYDDGRIVMLSGGLNPYDPELPEPKTSKLRNVWDSLLVELTFEGRIDLKFHSWKEEPYLKYWTIDIK